MQQFDLATLKASNPILDVVSQTVTLKRSGQSYVGLCPFHAHHKGTPSFAVWPASGTWKCFGQCAEGGDVIKFIMRRDNIDFKAACSKLGGSLTDGPRPARQAEAQPEETPPSAEWQAAGWKLLKEVQATLRGRAGDKARAYLQEQRLLTPFTIDRWTIGFIAQDEHVSFESWGLPAIEGKQLWLPRGIVIPTYDAYGQLWSIHVRRAMGDPKYPHITGSRKSLWGSQNIDRRIVYIWGGEFDAMLAEQEGAHAGGSCSPTTGEGSRWSSLWSGHMLHADSIFICYDNDEAGQRGAWRNIMGVGGRMMMAPRFPIEVKDLTDYARAGGSVRQWMLQLRQRVTAMDDPERLWQRLEGLYEQRDEHTELYRDLNIDFDMAAG